MAVSHSVGAESSLPAFPMRCSNSAVRRTFHATIAAEGMKASIEQAVAEERENAATHAHSQEPQGQVPARRSRL